MGHSDPLTPILLHGGLLAPPANSIKDIPDQRVKLLTRDGCSSLCAPGDCPSTPVPPSQCGSQEITYFGARTGLFPVSCLAIPIHVPWP